MQWRGDKTAMQTQHTQHSSSKRKPNIIYILADDMGYGDVSCLNENSKLNTIHLDKLASRGIAFTDAHSSSAVCTPSRYSILTGRYNWRSELKDGVLGGYSRPLIEQGRMTVASMLQEAGYRTACIGKWHLGMEWSLNSNDITDVDYTKPIANGPTAYGFDYYYGISASLDMPPYVYIENDRVTALPNRITKSETELGWWREGPTGEDFIHEEVLPLCTEKVLDWIDQAKDDPFFIYFPLPAPHTPVLPTEAFQGKSQTNAYGDFVLMVDDVVGQVVHKLEECGLADNTIVVFTSDNGCSPGVGIKGLAELGHHPSYVFRGYKADIFEGGHRIPLIMQWPEQIRGGQVCVEPVCLVDLMSTTADVLKLSLPDDAGEDSVSNLSVWLDQELKQPLREAIVHHSINGSFSIRKGKWKLELCPDSGGWSYPMPGEAPEGLPAVQLYDLSHDIGEQHNVCEAHPEIVQELTKLLSSYVKNGRSTPGAPQPNAGGMEWVHSLEWLVK